MGRALNAVSFFVNSGERVAILGHNGSGKSTLVKILGGLLENYDGECLINGINIKNIDFKILRSTIGLVFQDPENQIVAAVVEDDVAFSPENQGLPPDEIQLRVNNALEAVNISNKRNSSVSALSGGEKQRVAIAGALASQAKCLILDEPTAMLDPQGRLDVEKSLRKIHQNGTAIIQITHQIENFNDIDRIIVLSKGEIIWQGDNNNFWNVAENLGFDLPDAYKLKSFNAEVIAKNFKNNNIHEQNNFIEQAKNFTFEINNLSFKFDDNSSALDNISANIPEGQWLSIIGKTGSGKSTLVQHLNALYKIQSGKILFYNSDLPQHGRDLINLRKNVGLVFQNPEDQLFSLNVFEELAFAPKNAGFNEIQIENSIKYALEAVGLDEKFLQRSPLAFSGGERRLIAIASVLAVRPKCLILDEPLAGLDASYQKKILNLLSKLRDEGKTIITITHDLNTALKFSDRILILNNGNFINEGTPEEILFNLTQILSPETWPDVLKFSYEIHNLNNNFPLMYDYKNLLKCISQI